MDPLTISLVIGGWALGGVVGGRSDRLFCEAVRKVQRSFVMGLRAPDNHDLARAIRRSQLLALKLVVDAYEKLEYPSWRDEPGYAREDIVAPLAGWIQIGMTFETRLDADLAALQGVDEAAWKTRLGAIEAEIERVFVDPHDGPALDRQQALRRQAEDWTLDEIRGVVTTSGTAAARDWPRFEALFRGEVPDGLAEGAPTPRPDGGFPGWWKLFRAFMAVEVKADPKVQAILAQQGIARMLELGQDLMSAVAVLQADVQVLLDSLRDDLAGLRRALAVAEERQGEVPAALKRLSATALPILAAVQEIARGVDALPDRVGERIERSLALWFGIQPDGGFRSLDDAADRIRARPTELVIARYGVVPFHDRGMVLAELLAWAHGSADIEPRGRLYVAAGGFGKTRLAIELIRHLGNGWKATFLSARNAGSPGALRQLMAEPGVEGVLLVVDYAETQTSLIADIAEAARGATGRVRVLALARSAEGWWQSLYDRGAVGDLFEWAPRRPLETPPSMEERATLYDATVAAFRAAFEKLGIAAGERDPARPALSGRLFERPLGVAMAGYLAVRDGNPVGGSLLERMLSQERAHWKRCIAVETGRRTDDIRDGDPQVVSLHRLMAQVTLVQGATLPGALALAAADPDGFQLGLAAQKQTVALARTIYGVERSDPDAPVAALAPVEPDLLGEHLAMAALGDDGLAAATLRAALTHPDLVRSGASAIVTGLERAVRSEHDQATRKASARALESLQVAVEELGGDAVLQLADVIPRYSTPLARFSVAVSRRAVETANSDAARAPALTDYSTRLSDVGENRAALEPAREAVEIYERLVAKDPVRWLPDLATSHNNLAIRLSGVGEARAALESGRRAVEMWERLAAADPARSLPDLAMTLSNYTLWLIGVGELRAALDPARRSIEIRRTLAAEAPARWLPDLAASLNNYAMALSNVGEAQEALDPARRAVEIYEGLASAEPGRWLPDLSASLNNYANRLSKVGEARAALEPARRAIEIREELAAAEPMRWLPDLAASLNNYSNRLSKVGEARAALEPVRRAIDIREGLALAEPARWLPDLATSLNNYALRLIDVGEARKALEPARRAVAIRRGLAEAEPDRWLPEVGRSYGVLGKVLRAIGSEAAAYTAFENGVRAVADHAADLPTAFGGLLRDLIGHAVQSLRAVGVRDAEIDAHFNALGLNPALFEPGAALGPEHFSDPPPDPDHPT